MGLLAVLLMPVFSPPATQLVSWVFMLPFLTNFLLDWLAVSGVIRQSKPVGWLPANRQPHGYSAWLPLAVRILLIGLLLNDYFSPLNQMSSTGLSDLIALAAVLALLVGAAGRLFSLVVLLMTGFALQHHPLDLRLGAILLLSALLMMLGTGRFSLWKPEDWLLYKRAGEKQPVTQPHH
jgi:CDP-diacylglycerol--glycerol-3-phosphate 3-phosphatidyltransferase